MSNNTWPEIEYHECPRTKWGGILLFVYLKPKKNNFTIDEYRWHVIDYIQRCDHKPNIVKAAKKPWFGSTPYDDTSAWHNGKEKWKYSTYGRVIEYWFPNHEDDSNWERMKYVQNFWKWASESGGGLFTVRTEVYNSYREGEQDPRNHGGPEYEHGRRATKRVEPKYPSF